MEQSVFLCFTWLLFTWGVIDNGKIKLIRMNDETVEASYEAGGTNEQYQEKPKIALTFDDGPHPSSTPVLLDGLAGRNVKVTFFVIGENVVKYPKVVSREAEEGHIYWKSYLQSCRSHKNVSGNDRVRTRKDQYRD